MVQYRLQYFNLRARGEFLRYLFEYTGVKFDDERVDIATWVSGLKMKVQMNTLPVLYVDGTPLSGSLAIGAYLGKQLGLDGKTDYSAARCLMVAGVAEQFLTNFGPYAVATLGDGTNAGSREAAAVEFEKLKPIIQEYAQTMTKVLEANGTGWLVGNQLTWADLHVAQLNALMEDTADPSFLAPYPNLKLHLDRVHRLPAIKKHVATRSFMPL